MLTFTITFTALIHMWNITLNLPLDTNGLLYTFCSENACMEPSIQDSNSFFLCNAASVIPARSLGFTSFGEIFASVTVFLSCNWGSHIPSSWMVHAGYIFVASIQPSRTWTSGSFDSVRLNACTDYNLVLTLIQRIEGIGVRTNIGFKEKNPHN